MNIKRQLKDERRKIDEQILADGKETFSELAEQYCVSKTEQKPTKRMNSIKWIASVACVIVVCLVVCLCVVLTRSPIEPPTHEYFEVNQESRQSNFEEFSRDTKSSISFGNNYSVDGYKIVYDSESSDKLYYRCEFQHNDELIWGNLYVVINKNYNFFERHVSEVRKTKFRDYDMEYSVRDSYLDDTPLNEYFGCISLSDYKIYFSFNAIRKSGSDDSSGNDSSVAYQSVLEDLLILK